MSIVWTFHSFSMEAFCLLFGRGTPAQERTLVGVVTDPGWFAFADPDLAERVARRAVRMGLCYRGASATEVEILDGLSAAALLTDSLGPDLETRPESPNGLGAEAVDELLRRARGGLGPGLVAALAAGGRRYGEPEPSACAYCVFSPVEVVDLLAELRAAIASAVPWHSRRHREAIADDLLRPLEAAEQAGRGLAGFLI